MHLLKKILHRLQGCSTSMHFFIIEIWKQCWRGTDATQLKSPQPRHRQPWSRRHLGVWYRNLDRKEVCIPFLMQLDQLWLCLIGVILFIHHYSTLDKEMLLSGCWKLSLNSQSYKDRVIEKIGSGESVTWLVSNCDVTAGLLPLRYIFMWKKNMYDYITTGIIIKHVQNALPILI